MELMTTKDFLGLALLTMDLLGLVLFSGFIAGFYYCRRVSNSALRSAVKRMFDEIRKEELTGKD